MKMSRKDSSMVVLLRVGFWRLRTDRCRRRSSRARYNVLADRASSTCMLEVYNYVHVKKKFKKTREVEVCHRRDGRGATTTTRRQTFLIEYYCIMMFIYPEFVACSFYNNLDSDSSLSDNRLLPLKVRTSSLAQSTTYINYTLICYTKNVWVGYGRQ